VTLKPITVRLDEEEYNKLKELLNDFDDPDFNVAYVLRCYIRDLNRALPLIVKSGWDLKNYFALFGPWLKQFSLLIDRDKYSGGMMNPWAIWEAMGSNAGKTSAPSDSTVEKENVPAQEKNNGRE